MHSLVLLLLVSLIGSGVAAGEAKPGKPAAAPSPPAAEAAALAWDAVTADLAALADASRIGLCGRRSLDGSSVADVYKHATGSVKQVNDLMFNPIRDAGFGVRMIHDLVGNAERAGGPLADWSWHQGKLKTMVTEAQTANRPLLERSIAVATQAAQIEAFLAAATEAPAWSGAPVCAGWPGAAAAGLSAGLAVKDLIAMRRWSQELAAACAYVADLHRWQDALLANHLDLLAIQAQAKDLFEWADAAYAGKYKADSHAGRFTAGHALAYAGTSYLAVERQAEALWRWKGEIPMAEGSQVRLPPDARAAFTTLRSALGKAGQAVLDTAASADFDRSYLAGVCQRASAAGYLDAAVECLRRFDRLNPKPRGDELLDQLSIRGEAFSAFEWGDRYQQRVLDAAAKQKLPDNAAALVWAHQFTNTLYGGSKNYAGLVLTLRDSLDSGKMDCIRSTDLIAAAFRAAGRGGFYMLRWSRGSSGHSIAAADVGKAGKQSFATADGLVGGKPSGTFPEAYFSGQKDVYSVELLGRSLDGYALCATYFVRGPQAGHLVRQRVPWLSGWEKAGSAQVFKGPFPTAPTLRP